MRLLLDTHVWLWWLAGERLDPDADRMIRDAGNDVVVSAASVWEVSIKRAIGKLEVDTGIEDELDVDGFSSLPISVRHASVAGALPRHHDDPFDRMLVAQAQVEDLTVLTRDPRIRRYDVPVIPA